MSWVVEAIEKAAIEQASKHLLSGSATLRGFNAEQVMAFEHFFRTYSFEVPQALNGNQIFAELMRIAGKK